MKNLIVKPLIFLVAVIFFGSLSSSAKAESVYIENFIRTHSSTGGVSVDGADGEDGADGKDGKAGSDGKSVVNGDGSSIIKVKTIVNGETLIDETKHYSNTEASFSYSTGTVSVDTEIDTGLSLEERNALVEALHRIRLILLEYVSDIF